MSKISLLCYADGGSRTGFERVARAILTHLHQTGAYDITLMGIGYADRPYAPYPFRFNRASTDPNEPLGLEGFRDACQRTRPDVLLCINDLWNLGAYATLKPADLPMVAYFPVDAPNLKWQYCIALGAIERAVTYTKFAAEEAALGVRDFIGALYNSTPEDQLEVEHTHVDVPHPQFGHTRVTLDRVAKACAPEHYTVIPHGRDADWGRAPDDAIAAIKQRFNLDDRPILLNANANQHRKRQDLTLRIIKELRDRHRQVVQGVFFCGAGFSKHAYDLEQLVSYLGLSNQVTIIRESLTDQELQALHSAATIGINTSGGEGWGLGVQEGALCGTAQAVPNWAATAELWQGSAVLLPVHDYRVEPLINSLHGIVAVKESAEALVPLLINDEIRATVARDCEARARKIPTWNVVGDRFDLAIRSTLAPRSLTKLNMQQLLLGTGHYTFSKVQ